MGMQSVQFGTGWAGLALELMSLSGQHKQNPELRLWGGGETVYRGREMENGYNEGAEVRRRRGV